MSRLDANQTWLAELSWCSLWSVFLSLGWLLPNHYYPWIAFHTDAWVGWMFLIAAGVVGVRSGRSVVKWTLLQVLAVGVVALPFLQYAFGLIDYAGQAWIATAYLAGLFLAISLGASWETMRPDQPIDALLGAIMMASIASVGMQLYQWLMLTGLDIWIVTVADSRPFANLVQPNQLATLLLWGLIGTGWFANKSAIGDSTAMTVAIFLVFGLALTQSRTAMVAVMFIAAFSCYWRSLWFTRRRLMLGLGLLAFYSACLGLIPYFGEWLLLDKTTHSLARTDSAGIRITGYSIFLEALGQSPLEGYGWAPLAPLHLEYARNYPRLDGVFQQSHNIILELMLWTGIPIGLLITCIIGAWFYRVFKRITTVSDALLYLLLGIVWWHAMVELPLHYAYFLLPTGLIMGVLDNRHRSEIIFRSKLILHSIIYIGTGILFSIITYDYMRMEADFLAIRFERAYQMKPPEENADVILLTQLQAFNLLNRTAMRTGMSNSEMQAVRTAALNFPSHSNLYLYTASLALNGYSSEAHKYMKIMSKVMSRKDYENLGKIWRNQSGKNAELNKVLWLDF